MQKTPSALSQFLRRFPVETYVIFVVGVVVCIAIQVIDTLTGRWQIGIDPRSVLMGPMAGGPLLRYATIGIFAYGGILMLRYFLFPPEGTGGGIRRAQSDAHFFWVALSACYWFFVASALVFGAAAIFNVLFREFSYQQMAVASDLMMHWDHILFGIYPPFYLHTLELPWILQLAMTYAYAYLPSMFAVLLGLLFCTKPRLFRACLLSLTIATYLSLPFWIMFPAIPPTEAYQLNLLKREIAPDIVSAVAGMDINPAIVTMLGDIERMWFDPTGKSFSVSSFPSTHIIWAVIFLYATFRIRWWLGLLYLPFFVANFFATMFLLEHYAVDALFGIILGAIIIWLSEMLLRFENYYFTDTYHLLSIFSAMRFPPQKSLPKDILSDSRLS